jgi:molybdopterin synthase sulfur carrier subunit
MKAKVSFFAVLREISGVDQVELELPENCTISGFREVLLVKFPQLKQGLETAIIAIDHSLSEEYTLIKPGMDISIFPPIAGG